MPMIAFSPGVLVSCGRGPCFVMHGPVAQRSERRLSGRGGSHHQQDHGDRAPEVKEGHGSEAMYLKSHTRATPCCRRGARVIASLGRGLASASEWPFERVIQQSHDGSIFQTIVREFPRPSRCHETGRSKQTELMARHGLGCAGDNRQIADAQLPISKSENNLQTRRIRKERENVANSREGDFSRQRSTSRSHGVQMHHVHIATVARLGEGEARAGLWLPAHATNV